MVPLFFYDPKNVRTHLPWLVVEGFHCSGSNNKMTRFGKESLATVGLYSLTKSCHRNHRIGDGFLSQSVQPRLSRESIQISFSWCRRTIVKRLR